MTPIVILGCGGHAAVVGEACATAGFRVVGYFVEQGMVASAPAPDALPIEISRWEPIPAANTGTVYFALGVGNNEARLWWARKLLKEGYQLPPIVHARAWVSPTANLDSGAFVGAGAVVQAGAEVLSAAIINTNATVEHHCHIGAGAHVGPGAVLAGLVKLGEGAMVGAGASVKDRVNIGGRAVVGAGATVIRDVNEGVVVAGVPAKPI
jgi:sugar O-acyltransferase (sialic acid O-acetyltransferase NeuD family)